MKISEQYLNKYLLSVVQKDVLMEELGSTFDAYEVCLVKPGSEPFFEYANKNFPVHSGCPIIAGITKCIEAEANLALKADASIKFLDNE